MVVATLSAAASFDLMALDVLSDTGGLYVDNWVDGSRGQVASLSLATSPLAAPQGRFN